MTDESADNTKEAPPEARDSRLSSDEKDAFLANDPNAKPPTSADFGEEVPERHQHHGYDVKFRNATEGDADFDAPEQNAKKVAE